MIKPQSVQREYTLIFSGDPALVLPEDEEARDRLLKQARETGDWAPLIAEGQEPTLFHFRDLTRTEVGWWDGERSHSSRHDRPLSALEASDLALRIALRGVVNFGKHKVIRRQHGNVWLADESIIDAISNEAGSAPLMEFANVVLERAANPLRPL